MKTTKVFFDTEFTGLQQDTDLISIGFVAAENFSKTMGKLNIAGKAANSVQERAKILSTRMHELFETGG